MTDTIRWIAQDGIENSLPQLRIVNILDQDLRQIQSIVTEVGKHIVLLILDQLLVLIIAMADCRSHKHPRIEVGSENVSAKMGSSNCQTTTAHEWIKHEITCLDLALIGHQERQFVL